MNNSLSVLAALLGIGFTSVPVLAQEPIDREMLDRIRAEGLQNPQVDRLFSTLTDDIGSRLAASPGYVRATEWAKDELESWGLSDVRLHPFEFGTGWSLEKLTLEMTSPRFMRLMGIANAWSSSTAGELSGEALYVGDLTGEELEARGDQLQGGILLARPPQEEFATRDRIQPTEYGAPVPLRPPFAPRASREIMVRRGFDLIQLPRLQPGVVLYPSRGEHGTVFVGSSRPFELPSPDGPVQTGGSPEITVAAEHYNMLVRLIESGEPVELRVEIESRFHEEDANSYNVFGEIPGSDPVIGHEVVMIGAHLDSWHGGVGATDNADAVVAAMEAMRILTALDARPRRTIRVALWGGEEMGALGSQAYVEQYYADESSRDEISVYLNDDPGTGPTYGFFMEENSEAMVIFDELLGSLRDLGVRRNVFEGIGATDHVTFDRVGIPAFTAIKDYTEYDTRTHHTNADLRERVDLEDLTQSAVVLASYAWLASQREQKIPRRPPVDETAGRWGIELRNTGTGGPISRATVTIEGTGWTGTTDEMGLLVLTDVEAGRFTLRIEHPDFVEYRRENYPLRAGRLQFASLWLTPR